MRPTGSSIRFMHSRSSGHPLHVRATGGIVHWLATVNVGSMMQHEELFLPPLYQLPLAAGARLLPTAPQEMVWVSCRLNSPISTWRRFATRCHVLQRRRAHQGRPRTSFSAAMPNRRYCSRPWRVRANGEFALATQDPQICEHKLAYLLLGCNESGGACTVMLCTPSRE